MPTAILTPTQQRIEQIITDAHLLPKQKNLFLALTAESELPYTRWGSDPQITLHQIKWGLG